MLKKLGIQRVDILEEISHKDDEKIELDEFIRGFSNVDEVIDRLAKQLPKDIPTGCNVQFRLVNCDTQKEAVYERSKGKGF